jgi:hypothetical protein
MKKLTTLLFIVLINCGISFSQKTELDLKKLSIKELQQKKQEAISNSQYLLADEINKELNSRKSPTEIKLELEKQLKKALDKEDYREASILKSKLEKLSQIDKLDIEINNSLKKEDFLKAQQLKDEKTKILQEISGTGNTIEKTNSNAKTSNGQVNVIFSFEKMEGKINYLGVLDVVIDGKYYGTIDKNNIVTVNNLPSGKHIIELHLAPNTEKYAFISEEVFENGVYYLLVKHFTMKEQQITFSKNKKLNREQKLKSSKIYNVKREGAIPVTMTKTEQTFNDAKFAPNNPYAGTSNYLDFKTNLSGYKRPENVDKFFSINFTQAYTHPIVDGFIIGGSYGLSRFQFENNIAIKTGWESQNGDFTSMKDVASTFGVFSFNLSAIIGYQIEPTELITLQTYISAGPTYSYFSNNTPEQKTGSITSGSGFMITYGYETKYNSNSDMSFSGFWGTNAFLFVNKKQTLGLSTGLVVGFGGGVGATMGLVLGSRKKEFRHKVY